MNAIPITILSLLATSASLDRSFSTAMQVCRHYELGMKQDTIAARVMIHVDCRLAQSLLQEILALGRVDWARPTRQRE
jgi:hypothetical protein